MARLHVAAGLLAVTLVCGACTSGTATDVTATLDGATSEAERSAAEVLPREPPVAESSRVGELDDTAWSFVEGLNLEPGEDSHLSLWFRTDPLHRVAKNGTVVSASDGCNGFSGPYEATGSAIVWDRANIVSTMVLCEESVVAVAAEYTNAVFASDQFTVSGDELILSGPQGELRFQSIPIIDKAEVANAVWLLESVTQSGVVLPAVGENGFVSFAAFDRVSFSASTGCHRYAGTWSIAKANGIWISNLRTSGTCDDETTHQDALMRTILNNRSTVEEVSQTELRLSSPDGDQLLFRRSPTGEIPAQPVNFVAAPGS